MLKTGIQTKTILDELDLAEGVRAVREAGFACLDYNLNDLIPQQHIYRKRSYELLPEVLKLSSFGMKRIRRAVEEGGLTVSQCHAPFPSALPGRPRLNQTLCRAVIPWSLKAAAALGSPYLVMHSYDCIDQFGSGEEWKGNLDLFRGLIPQIRQTGVHICIENLFKPGQLMTDPREGIRLIDSLNEYAGEELFHLCLDIGHLHLTQLNEAEVIKSVGDRLKVLHIHDNDGEHDLHRLPKIREDEPQNGVDWHAFAKALCEIGFSGVLSLESWGHFAGKRNGQIKNAIQEAGIAARQIAEECENAKG